MVTSNPIESFSHWFHLPAIVTDNKGTTCLSNNLYDGYQSTVDGVTHLPEPDMTARYTTPATVLDPVDCASNLKPANQSTTLPIPTDAMITNMVTHNAAWEQPALYSDSARVNVRTAYTFTLGRYFGPGYHRNGYNFYGLTMNPRYRDFASSDVSGTGVHLHGIRFKMRVHFPGYSPTETIRSTDYCRRAVHWRLVLLPKSTHRVNPRWLTAFNATPGPDPAVPFFPPTGWECTLSASKGLGETQYEMLDTLDPLNTIFEAPAPSDSSKSYFKTASVAARIGGDRLCGGGPYTGLDGRRYMSLQSKVRFRRLPTVENGTVDLDNIQYMPYKPQILAGGTVYEENPRRKVRTTNTAVIAGGGSLVVPDVVETRMDLTPAAIGTTDVPGHTIAASLPVVAFGDSEEIVAFEDSFETVEHEAKFAKPLFVSYAPRVSGDMYALNRLPGMDIDLQTADAFRQDFTESAFPLVGPAQFGGGTWLDKVPAYNTGLADSHPVPRLSPIPFTNRIALYFWDNMPRSDGNASRPRVVPSMCRYETDA